MNALPSHALVLTAGLGTRLRPLTSVRAKPAVPVAGEPLVHHIIRWLVANRVNELVLNLHHRPDTLAAVVGDGADLGARVRYSWEQPAVLGSAGGVRQALPLVGADTFFVVNGDTLTDLPLAPLAQAHEGSGALVTLALVPNQHPDRYGGVRLDDHGAVIGFVRRGSPEPSYHFIGVQIVAAEAFRALPIGVPSNTIGGSYDELIARQPGAVRGYVRDAAFWDVGTIADYWATSTVLARPVGDGPIAIGRGCTIDPSAEIRRSILWDDVAIGAGCLLDGCIVTDRVEVPEGSQHRHAVLIRGEGGELMTAPLDI